MWAANVPSGATVAMVLPSPGDHVSATDVPGGKPDPTADVTNPTGPTAGVTVSVAPGVGGGRSIVGGTVTGVPGPSGGRMVDVVVSSGAVSSGVEVVVVVVVVEVEVVVVAPGGHFAQVAVAKTARLASRPSPS
jgi:hypothetical protein